MAAPEKTAVWFTSMKLLAAGSRFSWRTTGFSRYSASNFSFALSKGAFRE